MKMHVRTQPVNQAQREITIAVMDIMEKYDLTFIELVGIMASVLSSTQKHYLRAERHPDDPTAPADLE